MAGLLERYPVPLAAGVTSGVEPSGRRTVAVIWTVWPAAVSDDLRSREEQRARHRRRIVETDLSHLDGAVRRDGEEVRLARAGDPVLDAGGPDPYPARIGRNVRQDPDAVRLYARRAVERAHHTIFVEQRRFSLDIRVRNERIGSEGDLNAVGLEVAVGIGPAGVVPGVALLEIGERVLVRIQLGVASEVGIQLMLELVGIGQAIGVAVSGVMDQEREKLLPNWSLRGCRRR